MTIVVGNKRYEDIVIEEDIAGFKLWEDGILVGYAAMPVNQLSEIIS